MSNIRIIEANRFDQIMGSLERLTELVTQMTATVHAGKQKPRKVGRADLEAELELRVHGLREMLVTQYDDLRRKLVLDTKLLQSIEESVGESRRVETSIIKEIDNLRQRVAKLEDNLCKNHDRHTGPGCVKDQ